MEACDAISEHVASAGEEIGPSSTSIAPLARFAESRSRDAIERAGFRFAFVRERKDRPAPADREHAGGLPIFAR